MSGPSTPTGSEHFRPGYYLNADDVCLLITEHSAPYSAVQIANEHDRIVRGLVKELDALRAQAERVRVLEAKLEKIAGEAPAKEPRDEPSVAWPPSWSTDYRDHVNDMIREAFADGRNRGAWEAGQIADAALKGAA